MNMPVASLPPTALPPAHNSDRAVLQDETIEEASFWLDKERGMTFGDLLDIVNPLQHIPVVSTIYRAITGDEIGLGARVTGGVLFGGPIGAIMAGVSALVEEATGDDVSGHIASFFSDDAPEGSAQETAPQSASTAAATAAAPSTGAIVATALPPPVANATPASLQARQVPHAGAMVVQAAPQAHTQIPAQIPAQVPAQAAVQATAPMSHPFAARGPVPVNSQMPVRAAFASPNTDMTRAMIESQRVNAAVAAQNAAGNLPAPRTEAARDAGPQNAADARRHPFLPPRNAPPMWISDAMDAALKKYAEGGRR